MSRPDPSPPTVPLAEQPAWSRSLALLREYEPLSGLSIEQWRGLLRAAEHATREEDLSEQHRAWIGQAKHNRAIERFTSNHPGIREAPPVRVDLVQDGGEVVATYTLRDDGVAVRESGPDWLDELRVFEPGDPPTRMRPTDGERFLLALLPSVSGTRLRAVLVNDQDEGSH
jgi:hypothetical protein